jgi:hypothetical protein
VRCKLEPFLPKEESFPTKFNLLTFNMKTLSIMTLSITTFSTSLTDTSIRICCAEPLHNEFHYVVCTLDYMGLDLDKHSCLLGPFKSYEENEVL